MRSFVKEVLVGPGGATIIYAIPTPEDSPTGDKDTTEITLDGGVRSIGYSGGAGGTRTPGLHSAIVALSQLSYSPVPMHRRIRMELMGLEPMTSTMPLWRSPN